MSTDFTPREAATVLAALRYWQDELYHGDPISEHLIGVTPLTAPEIDELCERINFDRPGASWRPDDRVRLTLAGMDGLTG